VARRLVMAGAVLVHSHQSRHRVDHVVVVSVALHSAASQNDGISLAVVTTVVGRGASTTATVTTTTTTTTTIVSTTVTWVRYPPALSVSSRRRIRRRECCLSRASSGGASALIWLATSMLINPRTNVHPGDLNSCGNVTAFATLDADCCPSLLIFSLLFLSLSLSLFLISSININRHLRCIIR